MNEETSSALRTSNLYSQGNIPGTYFCKILSQTMGLSATGNVIPRKIPSDVMANRTATFRSVAQFLNRLRYGVTNCTEGKEISCLLCN
jgi:hypothetical protein